MPSTMKGHSVNPAETPIGQLDGVSLSYRDFTLKVKLNSLTYFFLSDQLLQSFRYFARSEAQSLMFRLSREHNADRGP